MISQTPKFFLITIAASLVWNALAAAQGALKVGHAETIRNEVVNVGGAQLIPINVGDEVVRDEIVRTSADSDARFRLLDNTKLTLGPGSTLKIDEAVYVDEARYKQITIRMTEGAFRFITGNSDKKSYKIETPFAVIGVRGTILDIRITEKQTLVALQDGKATVCAGAKCTQLLERGQTANVTRDGNVTQIRRDLVPSWTFASVCSGNSALCSPLPALTKKANLIGPAQGGKAMKKAAVTRFCPDGQPMVGSSCGLSINPTRDAALPSIGDPSRNLPLLSDPARDAPLPLPSNPTLSPASPRLSLPSLRR
jgi:hypothetical protein